MIPCYLRNQIQIQGNDLDKARSLQTRSHPSYLIVENALLLLPVRFRVDFPVLILVLQTYEGKRWKKRNQGKGKVRGWLTKEKRGERVGVLGRRWRWRV